jgi:RimJ/RimL family protein N-acetyltransferase
MFDSLLWCIAFDEHSENETRPDQPGAYPSKYSYGHYAVNALPVTKHLMISGRLVRLRPFESADLPLLRLWQNDSTVMTGWGLPHPLYAHDIFERDLRGRFAEFDAAGCFAISNSAQMVGRIDFHGFTERERSAELSLYIGEATATGKGFARDAIAAMARWLFNERRAARVELTVIAENARALRLYESMGFAREGVLRDYVSFSGRYHDEIALALYSEEMLLEREAR